MTEDLRISDILSAYSVILSAYSVILSAYSVILSEAKNLLYPGERSFLLLRVSSPDSVRAKRVPLARSAPRRGGIPHLRCGICVAGAQDDKDLQILL